VEEIAGCVFERIKRVLAGMQPLAARDDSSFVFEPFADRREWLSVAESVSGEMISDHISWVFRK
jgi:hypothetical protein